VTGPDALARGFPRRTLRADAVLYRVHRTRSGCWWFSDDGSGRFDPVGTGMGACYFAAAPLGAFIEVFRKRMTIAEAEIAERSLSAVTLGRPVRLADITSRRALGFGVSADLGSGPDYGPSHAFAARAVAAGFAGVRYLARHDPAQRSASVALFAAPGAPDPGDPAWPPARTAPIPPSLIDDTTRFFGYRVLPEP
jgi:hypothetical protein